ncbi:MAG: PD-(D/E)XK nuclease family transposase [Eubacterium sp.]|nr:PD-(D/E)XK nuclease family transposase [Eubacterium sp.]
MAEKKKHTENSEYIAKIMELCLLDDDFMTVVFEKKELAEFLLQIILEIPDLTVVYSKTQYNVKNLYGRSVRLDILAKDSKGKIYNIEVQRDDRFADPERARLNSSLIDANFSKKGKKEIKLPETYIIFITENDVLGGDLPIYHIERTIRESNSLFGDGAHIIYVNGENREDTALGHLMADFANKDPDKFYYKELADETRYYKHDEKGVRRMCKIMEDIRNEGAKERSKQNALNMLADGKLSVKDIAKYSGLTVAEVKALAKEKSA